MKTLKAVFNWALYVLSHLAPRSKRIWIFIGWRASSEREVFAENPKYQFLQVANNEKDIRAIWIGKDAKICRLLTEKGYEAYPLDSFAGAYYSLRAGYTFIGALLQPQNWRYAGGTRLIQLWHGKSLKKTGYNSPYSLSRYNRFLSASIFKEPFRFAAMSTYFADFVTQDFHIPLEKILITGLPKHDPLFAEIPDGDIDVDTEFQAAIEAARAKNPARLLLYGPTYRPDGTNPLMQISFDALNEKLASRNDRMIVIMHPKFTTREWKPDLTLSHVTFCQNSYDSYPLLQKFDVLISDYSSLSLEFLMMGKPTILFAYDLEDFKKKMGIYDELWDAMPEPKVSTFEELLAALDAELDTFAAKREESRAKLFDACDGKAAERITSALRATF